MPLPAQAEVRSRTRVTRVVDKGAGKGALVVTAREISDADSGQPLATVEHVSFCRADGGFGAGDEPPPALPAPPERAPDESVLLPTLPQQALLYRLNGDLNPVHAVPRMAREAGFDRPILHGLCTYGMAGRALAGLRPGRQAPGQHRHALFRAVLSGETLRVDIWRDGGRLQFRAWAQERGVAVLNNGVAELAA